MVGHESRSHVGRGKRLGGTTWATLKVVQLSVSSHVMSNVVKPVTFEEDKNCKTGGSTSERYSLPVYPLISTKYQVAQEQERRTCNPT